MTAPTTAHRFAGLGDPLPIDWFTDPHLPMLTPITVTREGRVFGHLCGWGVKHRGVNGWITPPRSRIDYREFLLHGAHVVDHDDQERTVAVGNLTLGIGHADMGLSLRAAVEHYDNADAIVAQVAAGEDQHGVWYAGVVLSDVEPARVRRLLSCGLSGDWRYQQEAGGLELCAALAVPVPGFATPRARVASGAAPGIVEPTVRVKQGEQFALVAAGMVMPRNATFGRAVDPAWEVDRTVTVDTLTVGKVTAGTLAAIANSESTFRTYPAASFKAGTTGARIEISGDGPIRLYGADGAQVHPSPADLADLIAARLDERKAAAELSAAHTALVSELDDTPAVVASLLDEVDDTGTVVASLLAEVDDTPHEVEALLAALDGGDADPKAS